MAKGNFRGFLLVFLEQSLTYIDRMPETSFNEIIKKYVEINLL